MKIISIIKKIAFVLLAIFVLHFSLRYLGVVMTPKYEVTAETEGDSIYVKDLASLCFSLERPHSIDTVFIGSSHVYCGIDVNIMNHEYGMNAAMLATTAQTLDLSYYAAMAAIEMQRPKTIVLEAYCARENIEQYPLASRSLLCDLPNWTKAKFLATKTSENPAYYYYYPIVEQHAGWWKIKTEDFFPPLPPRGERYSAYFGGVVALKPWETADESITAPVPPVAEKWLDEIIELCRDNDIKLILYTIPFPATQEQQAIFNGLTAFAQERNIEYYNLLASSEQVGIDSRTDFFDSHHLNRSGQVKVTRYLAEHCLNRQVS